MPLPGDQVEEEREERARAWPEPLPLEGGQPEAMRRARIWMQYAVPTAFGVAASVVAVVIQNDRRADAGFAAGLDGCIVEVLDAHQGVIALHEPATPAAPALTDSQRLDIALMHEQLAWYRNRQQVLVMALSAYQGGTMSLEGFLQSARDAARGFVE